MDEITLQRTYLDPSPDFLPKWRAHRSVLKLWGAKTTAPRKVTRTYVPQDDSSRVGAFIVRVRITREQLRAYVADTGPNGATVQSAFMADACRLSWVDELGAPER